MDFFAADTAPFAVALGLTIAITVIEVLGLLFGAPASAAIDGALPDLDADMDLGPLSQTLSWLSFGKLPALVVLILLTASFGVIGFLLQDILFRSFGFMLNPWVASVPALMGALYTTRHAGLAIANVMPREETDAVSTAEFVGRIATVFRGEASGGKPAEAKLTDIHGKTHYVLVEPQETDLVLPEGSEVVIVAQKGAVYSVIHRLKPAG